MRLGSFGDLDVGLGALTMSAYSTVADSDDAGAVHAVLRPPGPGVTRDDGCRTVAEEAGATPARAGLRDTVWPSASHRRADTSPHGG